MKEHIKKYQSNILVPWVSLERAKAKGRENMAASALAGNGWRHEAGFDFLGQAINAEAYWLELGSAKLEYLSKGLDISS